MVHIGEACSNNLVSCLSSSQNSKDKHRQERVRQARKELPRGWSYSYSAYDSYLTALYTKSINEHHGAVLVPNIAGGVDHRLSSAYFCINLG